MSRSTLLFACSVLSALGAACGSEDEPEPKRAPERDACGLVKYVPLEAKAGDIRAYVRDGEGPVQGALVKVGELPPTVTLADGAFAYKKADVGQELPARYDVMIYAPQRDPRTVFLFQQVARRDQAFQLALPPLPPRAWSADVHMRVVGAPEGAESVAIFSTATPQAVAEGISPTRGGVGETFTVSWSGGFRPIADVRQVFFRPTPGIGIELLALASASVRVEPGASRATAATVVPLATTPFTLNVTTPPGYSAPAGEIFVQLGASSTSALLETRPSMATGDTIAIPTGHGGARSVRGLARKGGARSFEFAGPIFDSTRDAPLKFAAAPEITAPADGATTDRLSFSVSTDGEECIFPGVFEVTLTPEDATHPRFVVFTAARDLPLPDASTLGFPLPRGARYTVEVTRWTGFRDMDEIPFWLNRTRTRFAISAPRTFTTPS